MSNDFNSEYTRLINLIKAIKRLIRKYEHKMKIIINYLNNNTNFVEKTYLKISIKDNIDYESLIDYYNYIISSLIKVETHLEKNLGELVDQHSNYIVNKHVK